MRKLEVLVIAPTCARLHLAVLKDFGSQPHKNMKIPKIIFLLSLAFLTFDVPIYLGSPSCVILPFIRWAVRMPGSWWVQRDMNTPAVLVHQAENDLVRQRSGEWDDLFKRRIGCASASVQPLFS